MISCVLNDCQACFEVEANFVEHLGTEHDIYKNLQRWVNFAKKRAGVPTKTVLEITLDEEEEIQLDNNVMTTQAGNILDDDRDKSKRHKVDFAVISKNVSRNIFANCRQLLEDPERQKMDDNYKVNKALISEENISDFFEKFRKKVENTEIPTELTGRLQDSKKLAMLSGPPVSPDLERTPPTPAPTRSRYERLLRCPVLDCEFTTDKAGMLRGEAARHLCDSHGVTAGDMTPGKFTFIKIKVEKTKY